MSLAVKPIWREIWKHKLVVISVGLLTLAGMAYVAVVHPKTYVAQAAYTLVNPPAPPSLTAIRADPALGRVDSYSPLVDYNNLAVVSAVAVQAMASSTIALSLYHQGVSLTYTVTPDANPLVPVLDVASAEPSPALAVRSARLVGEALQTSLIDLQRADHVNPRYMVTAQLINPATKATLKISKLLRLLIEVLGGGIVLLLPAVSVAHGLSRRRDDLTPGPAGGEVSDPNGRRDTSATVAEIAAYRASPRAAPSPAGTRPTVGPHRDSRRTGR